MCRLCRFRLSSARLPRKGAIRPPRRTDAGRRPEASWKLCHDPVSRASVRCRRTPAVTRRSGSPRRAGAGGRLPAERTSGTTAGLAGSEKGLAGGLYLGLHRQSRPCVARRRLVDVERQQGWSFGLDEFLRAIPKFFDAGDAHGLPEAGTFGELDEVRSLRAGYRLVA